MFSFMVTFLLFFQNSTRFIVCIGYQPPFKNTTALFLGQGGGGGGGGGGGSRQLPAPI